MERIELTGGWYMDFINDRYQVFDGQNRFNGWSGIFASQTEAYEFAAAMNAPAEELARVKAQLEVAREALRVMVYETTHLSLLEDDGSHKCRISKKALEQARAALKASE